jgi:hypothetical protein
MREARLLEKLIRFAGASPLAEFDIYHYPKSRLATFDVGSIGRKKHHIIGLLEIDVSLARAKIKEAVKTGRNISFTSWMIKVIGDTVAQNNFIHAINYRRRRQVAFKDVDISMPIEKTVEGTKVPLVTVLRKTNEKTIETINTEIQEAIGKKLRAKKIMCLKKQAAKR